MKTAIETREVIAFNAGWPTIRGTHHKPKNHTGSLARASDDNSTAILFLTGLADPQAPAAAIRQSSGPRNWQSVTTDASALTCPGSGIQTGKWPGPNPNSCRLSIRVF